MVFPPGIRNTGERAGEKRAVYQECPLQVSWGGARREEGGTGRLWLSGDAWNEKGGGRGGGKKGGRGRGGGGGEIIVSIY